MNLFKKQKNQFISQVVVLSMIFGFAAGVVGQIFSDVYINPWQQDYSAGSVNINQDAAAVVPELQRVKKFLGIQQDFEVNKTIEKISSALVGIYLKKPGSTNQLSQIYLVKELQANGFILTSDGWLVSYAKNLAGLKPQQLAVVYNAKTFAAEKIVSDATTGVSFIKIAATNLPVATLGDSDELVLGQLVLAVNNSTEATVGNVKNNNYRLLAAANNFLISSEQYQKLISLSGDFGNGYLGSPVLNLGGEVIGVVKEVDSEKGITAAIPINQFRSIVLDVLKNNPIKRPFLGINYLDLAWTFGLDPAVTQNLNQGALVYQNPKAGSPAAMAGILANDIITSVDGQQLDKASSLTDLIMQYRPGEQTELEILRAGKVLTKTVTLGNLP
ncbi:MAG: PDZ domain-containing protein [Patescibacteria group bacterium]|jgi:serine protease Do